MYKETSCGSRGCTQLKEVSENSLRKLETQQQRLQEKKLLKKESAGH
jgi:hypothetical protein